MKVKAVALIPDEIGLSFFDDWFSIFSEKISNLAEIDINSYDGVILDVHTDVQAEILLWLRNKGKTAIALDWYFDLGNSIKQVINLRGGKEALRHVIIRREFIHQIRDVGKKQGLLDAVLVMGGSDLRGSFYRLVKIITKDKRFLDRKITCIVSREIRNKFKCFLEKGFRNISIESNPRDLAGIMSKAKIGITNGGTTLMEFTFLGIPTIIFPQSEQEDTFIKTFIDEGCSLLGEEEQDDFVEQIDALWKDSARIKEMSENASGLIDGKGIDRIVNRILEIF